MKKTGRKNMAPRVSEKTFEFLAENFQSANHGAELLLDSFNDLFLITLRRELGKKFSSGELFFLVDIYNSTILSSTSLGQTLTGQVEDSFALYPGMYEEKWKIAREETEEKIKALTCFQAACIEIWANGFWYGGPGGENRDLNTYIKTLLMMRKKNMK